MCAHGDRPKGGNRAEVPSQEWDQIFKEVSRFSYLTTWRFRERSELRLFEGVKKREAYLDWKDFLLGLWRANVLQFSHFAKPPWHCRILRGFAVFL